MEDSSETLLTQVAGTMTKQLFIGFHSTDNCLCRFRRRGLVEFGQRVVGISTLYAEVRHYTIPNLVLGCRVGVDYLL